MVREVALAVLSLDTLAFMLGHGLPDLILQEWPRKPWWVRGILTLIPDLAVEVSLPAPGREVSRFARRGGRHCFKLRSPWRSGSSETALADLESLTTNVQRLIFFGAPFDTGFGVHDIHQNQGDPQGPFQHLDGPWQDGLTIAIKQDGSMVAFMNKFGTQSDLTDDKGLPA